MNAVFKKLNFKDHKEIYIINAPESFVPAMREMESFAAVKTTLKSAKAVSFMVAFVTKQKEVDELGQKAASVIEGDGLLWFAYPKGSSKKYKCEFNRDNGWAELGKQGFEPVRMVAIDEDWSALRFRKAAYIKTMTRSFAMSDEGKSKIASAPKKSPAKKPSTKK
jgi:hypothetical protein